MMRIRRNRLSVVLVAAGLTVSGVACSSGGSAEGGPIKVGVPLGLTGPAATTADWARMGVELAAEEINADGGIDGREVELVFIDTELDPTKAVTAVNRLINQDDVELIVGPMTSDETLATLPHSTRANIASINGSGSEITPEVAPLSFAMLPNAEHQAERMVEYAFDFYDAESVAMVAYSGTQGRTALGSFEEAVEGRGVDVVDQEFDVPVTDLTPQLLSVRRSDPDVLLGFHQTGDDTGRLVLGMRELNWDVPAIGSYGSTFAAQTLGVAGDDAYAGLKSVTWSAFSACTEDDIRPESAAFIEAVDEAFDEGRTSTAAYDYVGVYRDSLHLLKAAVEGAGTTDGEDVAAWLEIEGPEAAQDLPLAHEGYAMSADNHFLMDTSSLALVDPGDQLAPQIMRRIDCD